jgi:hypothetical protein
MLNVAFSLESPDATSNFNFLGFGLTNAVTRLFAAASQLVDRGMPCCSEI